MVFHIQKIFMEQSELSSVGLVVKSEENSDDCRESVDVEEMSPVLTALTKVWYILINWI